MVFGTSHPGVHIARQIRVFIFLNLGSVPNRPAVVGEIFGISDKKECQIKGHFPLARQCIAPYT